MTAFISIQPPTAGSGFEFLAIATCEGAVLDIASGRSAILAADRMRDAFPEAELDDNAAELMFAEMMEVH